MRVDRISNLLYNTVMRIFIQNKHILNPIDLIFYK